MNPRLFMAGVLGVVVTLGVAMVVDNVLSGDVSRAALYVSGAFTGASVVMIVTALKGEAGE